MGWIRLSPPLSWSAPCPPDEPHSTASVPCCSVTPWSTLIIPVLPYPVPCCPNQLLLPPYTILIIPVLLQSLLPHQPCTPQINPTPPHLPHTGLISTMSPMPPVRLSLSLSTQYHPTPPHHPHATLCHLNQPHAALINPMPPHTPNLSPCIQSNPQSPAIHPEGLSTGPKIEQQGSSN